MKDTLATILESLRASAAARDRQGGHAADEKRLLRDAGLLLWSIPARFGGQERSWSEIYRLTRRIAGVDSALAHVLAFHHLQVATVLIYGSEKQQRNWLSATADGNFWWGNAMNPLDPRLTAEESGAHLLLDGVKGFCSGSRGSTMMTLSAVHKPSGKMLLAAVPTERGGIGILDDWNPVGQRQTDSNSVAFDRVLLHRDELLRSPEAVPTPFQTLRTCFAQLVLVNLYAGIAAGALDEARRLALGKGRPRIDSCVDGPTQDPYMIRRFAEMHLQVTTADVMAERAAGLLEQAFLAGENLDAQSRAETALAIAEAKACAHRAGLHASEELFEVAGARGASAELALDRYWRNIRTHTLHDPLDHKLDALGRWALSREAPAPTLYN